LTRTVREELARIAKLCEEMITEQSSFEESLTADFKDVELMLKRIEGSKGNHPVTAEDARTLALLVRQAIEGDQVNAQGNHLLMLLFLQLSLLAQQDVEMKVEASAEMEKALGAWFEHWDAAKSAWNQYTR